MNAEVKSGYKQTEVGLIPEDWFVTSLGNSFGKITTGKLDANAMSENGEYPFFTCAKEVYRINHYAFDCDALLISGNGANVGYVHHYNGKFNAYQRTYVLTEAKHDIHYLKVYVEVNLQERLRVEVNAGNTPYIVKSTLSDMPIGLPKSSIEQQRIAFTLADIDALISSLDHLISKKRDIQQATMQQLLTGQRRLPGFSGEWEVKRLGEIGEISGAGVDKKIRTEETEVKLLNYTDVYKKDFLRSSDFSHVVTAKPEQISRCGIKKCDVFFTPTSETRDDIGHAAVSCEDMPGIVYSYHVVRLRPTMELNTEFLGFVFKSKAFKDQASTLCEGSGTRYVITLPKFRAMNIFLPSDVSEQAAIGGILFEMSRELLALEARRDKARMLKQGMMQELLTGRIRLTNQGI